MKTAEEAKKAIEYTDKLYRAVMESEDIIFNYPENDSQRFEAIKETVKESEMRDRYTGAVDDTNPADTLRAYIEETEAALKTAVDEIDTLRAENLRLKTETADIKFCFEKLQKDFIENVRLKTANTGSLEKYLIMTGRQTNERDILFEKLHNSGNLRETATEQADAAEIERDQWQRHYWETRTLLETTIRECRVKT